MIGVDPKVIIEGLLIVHGFIKANNELSTRLLKCLEKLQVHMYIDGMCL